MIQRRRTPSGGTGGHGPLGVGAAAVGTGLARAIA